MGLFPHLIIHNGDLDVNHAPVSIHELLVSTLAQSDALAKLLIEKGIITREEFMAKIAEERATYQAMLNPTPQ